MVTSSSVKAFWAVRLRNVDIEGLLVGCRIQNIRFTMTSEVVSVTFLNVSPIIHVILGVGFSVNTGRDIRKVRVPLLGGYS